MIIFQRPWPALLALIAVLAGSWGLSVAASMEAHRYIEDDGNSQVAIQWCLSGVEGRRLIYQTSNKIHVTYTDATLRTLAWSLKDPGRDADIEATRQNNTITITGHWRGERIERQLTLDDAPWFQATSLSLRPFVTGDATRTRFWIVRPDTLKAYKVTATRQDEANLALDSGVVRAVRVELRLAGVLAPLWHSRYWFRAADGLFLRFEGPGDAAGRNTLTVEYEGPGGDCTPSLLSTDDS